VAITPARTDVTQSQTLCLTMTKALCLIHTHVSATSLRARGRAVYMLQPYSLCSFSHQRVIDTGFGLPGTRAWAAGLCSLRLPVPTKRAPCCSGVAPGGALHRAGQLL